MEWVFGILGALWILGWLAALSETEAQVGTKSWQKIAGVVALFFMWPLIRRSGH